MKVPTVEGPSVEQRPLGTPETRVVAGPGAFGASIAQGLANVGQTLQGIAEEQKRRSDSAKIVELAGLATDANNKTLLDAQKKFLKGAEGSAAAAAEAFEKTNAAAIAAAQNGTQQEILTRTLTQQRVAMMDSAREHEARELQKYDEFSAKKFIDAAEETAATSPKNWELTDIAKGQAAAAASQLFPPGSISDEQREQVRGAAVSGVTARQLSSLIAQGDDAAFLVMYPFVKAELVGKDAETFAKIATQTSDAKVDQGLTAAIFAKTKGKPLDAYGLAREMLEGDQEDRVIKRLDVMFAEAKGAANDTRQSAIDTVYEQYVAGGYKLSAVRADALTEVMKHDAQILIPLHNLEVQKAEKKFVTHSDSAAYSKWWGMSEAEMRSVQGDPLLIVDKLSESDFQTMVRHREALKKEQAGFTKGGMKETAATEADVGRTIKGKFLEVYKEIDGHEQKWQTYERIMRQEITGYMAKNKGIRPPVEVIEQASAIALAEGKRIDAGFMGRDITGRRFEAQAKGEVFRPNDPTAPASSPLSEVAIVPDNATIAITNMLREAGVAEPTREQILRAYKKDPQAWDSGETPAAK